MFLFSEPSPATKEYHKRIRQHLHAEDAAKKLVSLYEAALASVARGTREEAAKAAEDCSLRSFETVGDTHPLSCLLQFFYCDVLAWSGDLEKATLQFSQVMNALAYSILKGLTQGDREAAEIVALLAGTALSGRQLVKVLRKFSDQDGGLKEFGNLSSSLMNREWEQCYYLSKAVYDIRLKTKGFKHADTLLAAHKFGVALTGLNKGREARALNEKVFRQRQKLYGFGHVLTLRSAGALAHSLFATGDKKQALSLQERVYRKSLEINGKDHEQTRIALNNLREMQKG